MSPRDLISELRNLDREFHRAAGKYIYEPLFETRFNEPLVGLAKLIQNIGDEHDIDTPKEDAIVRTNDCYGDDDE